jgi:hypothetical protein
MRVKRYSDERRRDGARLERPGWPNFGEKSFMAIGTISSYPEVDIVIS